MTVDHKLVKIALEEVSTSDFEKFCQSFWGAIIGREFVPLGGVHDGGADGCIEPELFEEQSTQNFIQISKQVNVRTKIVDTINRLREFGRELKSITYLTNQEVTNSDRLEYAIYEEYSVKLQIRDRKYIEAHINYSNATIQAFNSYLSPHISHLRNPGNSPIAKNISAHADRTLATFLRQEVERRAGQSELMESVSDSLILWSLSKTDPHKNIFMTRDQVLQKIEKTLPSAKQFIRSTIDTRLGILCSKANGRKINFHKKENGYCLPFETRESIFVENEEEAVLKNEVTQVFMSRLRSISQDIGNEEFAATIELCHSVLEKVFEKQGLLVAEFAHGTEDENRDEEIFQNISEIISNLADDRMIQNRINVKRNALAVLKKTFYNSHECERVYIRKLSRTYVLLFLLKNEPKIVEYFKSITGKFYLYLGTDFLVKALSEHFLPIQDQTTRNLFALLRDAGSTLAITEKSVIELTQHLKTQILEFQNFYQDNEDAFQEQGIEYIDRILIRTYFYAKHNLTLGNKRPATWRSFIEQFASYDDICKGRADNSLAQYLVEKFGFEYENEIQLSEGLEDDEITALADEILTVRESKGMKLSEARQVLATNDAIQILKIYKRRLLQNEGSPANPFGYRTWLLTHDQGIRKAASEVVKKNAGKKFVMRPEFLLNFIAFTPSKREVAESYASIFPTSLGISLSNRMDSNTLKKVLEQSNELHKMDDARAASIVTGYMEHLKGDMSKAYEISWASNG